MKGTKKALWASALALVASIALFAGLTFAWFTDLITNDGNTIKAGSLAIKAESFDLDANRTDFTI